MAVIITLVDPVVEQSPWAAVLRTRRGADALEDWADFETNECRFGSLPIANHAFGSTAMTWMLGFRLAATLKGETT